MPEWLPWVLAPFACYRLARLLALEEGPWGVLERLRAWAGAYDYGEDGQPETNLGRGVRCPLCVGVYVAALLVGLLSVHWAVSDVGIVWLGMAGAQAYLQKSSDGD